MASNGALTALKDVAGNLNIDLPQSALIGHSLSDMSTVRAPGVLSS
jgi:histidinol phosphatase-like enzyme